MGSGLTFSGQDADVVLEDRIVKFVGATDEPVVILRSDISAVELTKATLLGYGRLVISTRAGDQHTVRFTRDAQEHFDNLEAIIRP